MYGLTKLTDDASLIMGHMIRAPKTLHTAKNIASHTKLSQATVDKILKKLTTSGLFEAKKGGYCFKKALPQISVASLIDALNGPRVEKTLQSKVQMIVYSKLKNVTLADLLKPDARQAEPPTPPIMPNHGLKTKPH